MLGPSHVAPLDRPSVPHLASVKHTASLLWPPPFLNILPRLQVSVVEGRLHRPIHQWLLSTGPITCCLGLQRHHLAGERIDVEKQGVCLHAWSPPSYRNFSLLHLVSKGPSLRFWGKRGLRTLQSLRPHYLISMAPPPTRGFYSDCHLS